MDPMGYEGSRCFHVKFRPGMPMKLKGSLIIFVPHPIRVRLKIWDVP